MIKKLLLFCAIAILVFLFAGCDQAEDVDTESTQTVQSGDVDVELTEIGTDKVKVIKIVRIYTGLELKETKNLVDAAPSIILENVSQKNAEEIKAELEEVGATVTLKQE